jgi:anti-sigma B factor antagonist
LIGAMRRNPPLRLRFAGLILREIPARRTPCAPPSPAGAEAFEPGTTGAGAGGRVMGDAAMTTRRQADGTTVVDVRGSLDAASVDGVRTSLLDTLQRDRPRLMVVDLTLVTFMDSVGIGMLLAGHEAARDVGARFVLRNPSEFVYRQLRLTGLAGLFGLSSTTGQRNYRI